MLESKIRTNTVKKINLILLAILLIACEGEQGEIGPTGSNSLINIVNEPVGTNCTSGGFKIDVGIDSNNNGVLDTDEIQSTQYICNGDSGSNGLSSLVNVTDDPAGINCTSGGFKIDVGIDSNNNGVLDTDEIQSTQYICNGDSGSNGLSSLVNVTDEPAGINCTSGGFKIDVGIDSNNNGVLDTDEIQSTQYICNGDSGSNGLSSLVNVTDDPAGINCTSGGFKIDVGIDSNNNGVLDTDEIQSTQYICNGEIGSELRFNFNTTGNGSFSTTSSNVDDRFFIPSFTMSNYVGVDSVALGATMVSTDLGTNCIIELYDLTNDAVIANSQVSTNSLTEIWVSSTTNFISEMPNDPVDLAVRISSDNGANVRMLNPTLFLIWK